MKNIVRTIIDNNGQSNDTEQKILAVLNKIITTNKKDNLNPIYNINYVDNEGFTAIMTACKYKLIKAATNILTMDLFDSSTLELTDIVHGNTALMWALNIRDVYVNYKTNMFVIAGTILSTNKSNPDNMNKQKETALLYANMHMVLFSRKEEPQIVQIAESFALKLLTHSLKNVGNASLYPPYPTPLIMACIGGSSKIVTELVNTGLSNPSHVFDIGNGLYRVTALDIAVTTGQEQCAMKLLGTGNAEPEHIATIINQDVTTLTSALKNNMFTVIFAIENEIMKNKKRNRSDNDSSAKKPRIS